ncbi:vWA domain-containing protein [Halopseudomonas pelagia]|uniref:vWA domain-containing protein n=1 Tax=Halopseudomonas pelagia TaxID=553151 RepID=UPI00039E9139|nr:VWA domain-containing protein [Halopseudomonas pelagia]|tara:strand:+ start:884 stop:1903 length:1020 start_codon:yes stop_codon:yes gene_type:complete
MLDLAWPAAALLLPLPWLLRWLLPAASNRTAALQVAFLPRLQKLPVEATAQPMAGQRGRFALIWLLLVLACMRPQWLGDPLPISVSGRDMMIAVDLSGSMEYADMQLEGAIVDRLTLVKKLLGDFIAQRQGDRIGLILFGSNAYVQAPLTHDLNSVRVWLDEAFIGLAGRQTAIGNAVGLAVKRLTDEPAESRVLILITDGANNAGQINPLQAARLAATEHIRIFTIGVGAESALGSNATGMLAQGTDPSVELDEGTLTDIALATGGEYFRARDGESFNRIYQRIEQLEPALRDRQPRRQAEPLYPWPLGLALLLSLLLAAINLITHSNLIMHAKKGAP